MFTVYDKEVWRLILLVYAKETGKIPHVIVSPLQDMETLQWLHSLDAPKIEITELNVSKKGTISSDFDVQDNTCIVYLTAYNIYNGARNHLQKIYDKLLPFNIMLFIDAPYKVYWDSVKDYCDGVWDPQQKRLYLLPQIIQDYGLREYNPMYIDKPIIARFTQPDYVDSMYESKHNKIMETYKKIYKKIKDTEKYIGFDPYDEADYMITPTAIVIKIKDELIVKKGWHNYKKKWQNETYACIPLEVAKKNTFFIN
jgi:hypothetical protein